MNDLVVRAMQELATTPLVLAFLDAALKGTLLLAVAGLLCLLGRRWSAAIHHLIWSLGLTSLLVLPVLSLALPAWQVPVLPRPVSRAPVGEAHLRCEPAPLPSPAAATRTQIVPRPVPRPSGLPVEPVSAPTVQTDSSPRVPPPSGRLNWPVVAVLVWSIGAGSALLRLVSATASVWRLTQRAEVLTNEFWTATQRELSQRMKLARRARLLASNEVHVPMTWGLLRPVVLLPPGAESWAAERRRVALLHELAHVKRWDYLTQTIAWFACALHWANPLAWFAFYRMRVEREQACDDHVLNAGLKPSSYAQHLLEIARGLRASHCAAAVAMARASGLEGRVRAVLEATRPRRAVTRLMLTTAVALSVVLILPLSALRPTAMAQEAGGSPSPNGAARGAHKPGLTLSGKVVDPRGRPVAGSRVLARFEGETDDRYAHATAGKGGEFRLDGIKPNTLCGLWVKGALTGPSAALGRRLDVAVGQEPPRDLLIQLAPVATIAGRVVDAGGQLLESAGSDRFDLRVVLSERLGKSSWRTSRQGLTKKGLYEFRVLPGSTAFVTAELLSRRHVAPATSSGIVTVPGERREVDDIVLRDVVTITGAVLDREGNPLSGAVESAWRPASELLMQVKSNEDGEFRSSPLRPPDTPIQVCARSAKGDLAGRAMFHAAKLDGDTILELAPSATAVGRVVDAKGQPIASAKVSARIEANADRSLWCHWTEAPTDANGRYRLTGILAHLPTKIGAEAEGYGSWFAPAQALEEGQTLAMEDLVLTVGKCFVAGMVTDRNGWPAQNIAVSCWFSAGSTERSCYVRTDAQGRYRIEGLPDEGNITVCLGEPDYERQTQYRVPPDSEHVDFTLAPRTPSIPQSKIKAVVGQPAPKLVVAKWINSEPLDLAELRGRAILLTFWQMLPQKRIPNLAMLKALEKRYPKQLAIVMLHPGRRRASPTAMLFAGELARKNKLAWPMGFLVSDGDNDTRSAYSVNALPASFVVDRDGILRHADLTGGIEEKVTAVVEQTQREGL